MRKLWVVLAACGGSSKPAMGPPPPPAKIAETERAEPVERAAPAPAPAPQVASDPEEGGQVASSTTGLGSIGASQRSAADAKIALGPASGDIDRAAIQKVVKRNTGQIRYCYEAQLAKNPALQGRVDVTFVIGTDGHVTEATADGVDPELDQCIAGRFKTWVFGKQPAPAKIAYPIVLTPP